MDVCLDETAKDDVDSYRNKYGPEFDRVYRGSLWHLERNPDAGEAMDMDGHTDLQWRSYKTNPGEFGILVLWVVYTVDDDANLTVVALSVEDAND